MGQVDASVKDGLAGRMVNELKLELIEIKEGENAICQS